MRKMIDFSEKNFFKENNFFFIVWLACEIVNISDRCDNSGSGNDEDDSNGCNNGW